MDKDSNVECYDIQHGHISHSRYQSIAHVQSLHWLHSTHLKRMRWQAITLIAINNKCLYVFGGLVNFVVMCSNFTSCCDDTRGSNSVQLLICFDIHWFVFGIQTIEKLNVQLLTICNLLSWISNLQFIRNRSYFMNRKPLWNWHFIG